LSEFFEEKEAIVDEEKIGFGLTIITTIADIVESLSFEGIEETHHQESHKGIQLSRFLP
jgi:hypothetical protein